MGRLHEIRLRSDSFIANIDDRINESIMFAETQVVDLNREQMKDRQVDSKDDNLPEYSSFSKSLKGLTYFNLFSIGTFQQRMFMTVKYPTYQISSRDGKLNVLLNKVGDRMFGVAPSNRTEAKRITGEAFARKYKSYVFQR